MGSRSSNAFCARGQYFSALANMPDVLEKIGDFAKDPILGLGSQ
jgi:hypothetical protein